jgi:hypothetical protein
MSGHIQPCAGNVDPYFGQFPATFGHIRSCPATSVYIRSCLARPVMSRNVSVISSTGMFRPCPAMFRSVLRSQSRAGTGTAGTVSFSHSPNRNRDLAVGVPCIKKSFKYGFDNLVLKRIREEEQK